MGHSGRPYYAALLTFARYV
ncbi:MAG: hypothetical protein NTY08_10195 [Proteobacteria bacterium]|nr:hypothetical protein [Pseudomonadota bacterium]